MKFKKELPENFTAQQFYDWISELVVHAHEDQMYGRVAYTYHLQQVEETFVRLLDIKSIIDARDAMELTAYSISEMILFLKAACLSHDLFEDTKYNAVYMRTQNVPEWFIQVIIAVTKTKGMGQVQYLNIVARNPLAVLVKTPDSLSNLQHSIQSGRLSGVVKYTNVLRYLNGDGKIYPQVK